MSRAWPNDLGWDLGDDAEVRSRAWKLRCRPSMMPRFSGSGVTWAAAVSPPNDHAPKKHV